MRYRLRGISLISAGKIAIYSLLAAGSAFAQNDRGAITGNITDQDGATVSGAVVQAKNSSSGAIYKATSLSSGDYKFEGLAPGAYEISIPILDTWRRGIGQRQEGYFCRWPQRFWRIAK